MTEDSIERHGFQSEARRVLDLMINSVYSNPEIFLRELISNASDALDKLRVLSLTEDELRDSFAEPRITVAADRASRTIAVRDNGIGMTKDELIRYLGTVAFSGTGEFAASRDSSESALIGQFGVGFYSAFIVASRVDVVSRRAGSNEAWKWSSDGTDGYTIEPASLDGHGTLITLHIKETDPSTEPEDRGADYLSDFELRSLIKKYSDFISYPIYVKGGGADDEPANSMKAVWTRDPQEVSSEEYEEFYKHIAHDWEPPLDRITYKAEGTSEFSALLFIPSHPPIDLFDPKGARGIELYIRRVWIMSDCQVLLPEYLRFVRGVVDSEDMPLNISRELLQQDASAAVIKRGLTRKVLDSLRALRTSDAEKFAKFWDAFGQIVKEGLVRDHRNRDLILKLCVFETTDGSRVSLDEYAKRMKAEQSDIYYLVGPSIDALRSSPKLESFRRRGIEVLLLHHPVDEFWANEAPKFGDHKFVSAASEDIDLPGAEDAQDDSPRADDSVAARLKDAISHIEGLSYRVDDVRTSLRLVDSPATFVSRAGGTTPQMRAMMRVMGTELPPESKILEINPRHPLIIKIAAQEGDLADWASLLLGLAQTADGEPVDRGAEFALTVARLLA